MTWTPKRHEAAKQRCDAATEGPWQPDWAVSVSYSDSLGLTEEEAGRKVLGPPEAGIPCALARVDDVLFMAAARTDLPDALEEIERLQGVVTDFVSDLELIERDGHKALVVNAGTLRWRALLDAFTLEEPEHWSEEP